MLAMVLLLGSHTTGTGITTGIHLVCYLLSQLLEGWQTSPSWQCLGLVRTDMSGSQEWMPDEWRQKASQRMCCELSTPDMGSVYFLRRNIWVTQGLVYMKNYAWSVVLIRRQSLILIYVYVDGGKRNKAKECDFVKSLHSIPQWYLSGSVRMVKAISNLVSATLWWLTFHSSVR